jgi:hypothetical protein
MNLLQQFNLAQNPQFQERCAMALEIAMQNVASEVVVEQQTVNDTGATAGTFTMVFGGSTSTAIQWNTSAIALQTILNAMASIGAGGVECTGGPLPGTAITINYVGSNLVGRQPLPTTGTNSLTGGTPAYAETTAGTWVLSHVTRLALEKKVMPSLTGGAVGPYGAQFATAVAVNATVQNDFDPNTYNPRGGSITGATAANPCVITSANHGLLAGTTTVLISGAGGNINGVQTATKIDANTFSIPVLGPGAGGGTWAIDESQILNDVQFATNSVINAMT